jgi:hypothetical protein
MAKKVSRAEHHLQVRMELAVLVASPASGVVAECHKASAAAPLAASRPAIQMTFSLSYLVEWVVWAEWAEWAAEVREKVDEEAVAAASNHSPVEVECLEE